MSQDKKFIKRKQAAGKFLTMVSEEKLPMCGAHIVADFDNTKYQCFTNGYVGFMLNEPLPDLHIAEPYNMVKKVTECERNMNNAQSYKLNLKEIRSHIKTQKEKNKEKGKTEIISYQIGNHFYNAQYILEIYEILGGDIEMFQDELTSYTPGIFKSENGKAILMPLKNI